MCFPCVQKYIIAQTSTQAWDAIKCPDLECGARLGYNDMQSLAPADVFARFDAYLNQKALEELPEYCSCANADCRSGGVIDLAIDTFMICDSCDFHTCITCRTQFHPGLTREENSDAARRAERDAERTEQRKKEEAS